MRPEAVPGRVIVVPGSASRGLGKRLAACSGAALAAVESRRFPDGEAYVRIDHDLRGENVVVVQTTAPDANLVEHLLLLDAAREAGARRVVSVAPYYGYSRQDKRFRDGEPVSARAVARSISGLADSFVTVDIHADSALSFFTVPAANVTPVGPFAEYLRSLRVDLILAPDKGALARSEMIARAVGCRWEHLEKRRVDSEHVTLTPKELDVRGRRVAIVDDIISTGGTILAATKALRHQGAAWVAAACTHGLFIGGALDKLKEACDHVIASDSIDGPASVVSVAVPVAEALKAEPS